MSHNLKLILVGDGAVGKTTFVKRHRTGEFEKQYLATIGVETNSVKFSTSNGPITFNVWDCAGQAKYAGLGSAYYKDATCAIVMFSVGSTSSFASVQKWLNEIKSTCGKIPIILCGTKCDEKDRKVTPQQISKFIRKTNLKYYDISAKTNYNFEKPFLELSRQVLGNLNLAFVETVPEEFEQYESEYTEICNQLQYQDSINNIIEESFQESVASEACSKFEASSACVESVEDLYEKVESFNSMFEGNCQNGFSRSEINTIFSTK